MISSCLKQINLKEKIVTDNEKCYILRPLNIKAKLILSMKPHQENFKRPMFDIKIDLDEINLNINRNQVKNLHKQRFLFSSILVFRFTRFT